MKKVIVLCIVLFVFVSCSKKDTYNNQPVVLSKIVFSSGVPYAGLTAYPTGKAITIYFGVDQKGDNYGMTYSLRKNFMGDLIDTGSIGKTYISRSLQAQYIPTAEEAPSFYFTVYYNGKFDITSSERINVVDASRIP